MSSIEMLRIIVIKKRKEILKKEDILSFKKNYYDIKFK